MNSPLNSQSDKPRILIICTHFHSDRTGKNEKIFLQTSAGVHVGSMIDLTKYDVKLYHESYHGPYDTEHLDDVVLVFLTGLQKDFDRMRQLAYFFRRQGTPVVAGGNICTMFPEFATEFFDAVSVGGVECILAIMRDFEQGQLQTIYRSPQTQLSNYVVKYELLRDNHISSILHLIEASRGCNFKCDFCVIPAEGASHTTYRVATVIETIQHSIQTSPRWSFKRLFPVVFFIDNNFSNNIPHLKELCIALKHSRLLKGWGALVTQNVLQNREIVDLMSNSGCRVLFTGIESFDLQFLDRHNKVQNTHQSNVFDDIEYAQNQGIAIMYPYMFDPRFASVAAMRQDMQMLTGLDVVAFPDFFTIVAPLVGTKLFWNNVDEGGLLPNLRLRDLDGQTLAYRHTVDDHADYSEFLRILFSDPMQLVDRVKFWRNLALKTLKVAIHHPIAGYVFGSSSLNQFKGMFKIPEGGGRNFIGGQDILDPQYEQYPDDISSEDKSRYFDPIKITDDAGNLQPWLRPYHPQTSIATTSPVANG